ncbi:MAG TPA: pyridoxal-dependent decarboxylase [Bryobacteraceae bacterium]|jgi:aromatic-L-amino-acid decarboxylase|nr:pyridoxal-dependent decarboxylase [Bryobacteraceae bacterium]
MNKPPPEWPAGSIASACETSAWPPGEFASLAALAAAFVVDETRCEGPLKGGATPAQSWMTSGSALARQAATQSWEAARASLAVGGTGTGIGLEAALRRLLDCSRDAGTEDRHGGMFAYAPTGALPASALAAFVCASINPGLTWMPTSPQFAALERCVLDWVAGSILSWPDGNSGVFTSGGSVANTLALHVARHATSKRAGVAPEEVLFFVPDHVHYCIPKGLALLGVGRERIIRVACDGTGTLNLKALASELRNRGIDDSGGAGVSSAGVVIAIGGETNTGSTDDLLGLAELRRGRAGLWLHIDACFGGFFGLTERGRQTLRGIEQADSVALDPHKALQVPYGVGMLMVRDESNLQRAFRMGGAYVPPAGAGRYTVANISDLGIELTREARGAQVWLPLIAYGSDAFAKHLDWCLDAIDWLAKAILEAGEFELVSGPKLSTLNFRMKRTFAGVSPTDAVHWLVDDINARGRVLLAPAEVYGEACVRVCILSARSSPRNLRELRSDVVQAGAALAANLARLENCLPNQNRSLGFRVPYRVRPIPAKGLGVTATEEIEAGRLVWEFEEGACLPASEEMVETLALQSGIQAASDFLNHCFCWEGRILYPQGDTQFFNHSSCPNIASPDGVRWFATRAILAGEELLDDYGTYENNPVYERLCRKYKAESSSSVAEIYRS